jgi:hypothetical protein
MVLVHAGLFRVAMRAINRTIPFNIASALLVIAAGFSRGAATEYWLWGAATLVRFITPYLSRIGNFRIEPAYFVE